MSRKARRFLAMVVASATLAVPATAAAQCPQTSVADIEDEVMCPVCGTPLALATEAPQADRQRQFILGLVEQCRSKEEVKSALVAEYGEAVLALPEEEGFNLAAYFVPALAVVLAGAAIGFATLRWRRDRPAASTASPADDEPPAGADDSRRLDADLRRYDL